jgi:hypothetical protein
MHTGKLGILRAQEEWRVIPPIWYGILRMAIYCCALTEEVLVLDHIQELELLRSGPFSRSNCMRPSVLNSIRAYNTSPYQDNKYILV